MTACATCDGTGHVIDMLGHQPCPKPHVVIEQSNGTITHHNPTTVLLWSDNNTNIWAYSRPSVPLGRVI